MTQLFIDETEEPQSIHERLHWLCKNIDLEWTSTVTTMESKASSVQQSARLEDGTSSISPIDDVQDVLADGFIDSVMSFDDMGSAKDQRKYTQSSMPFNTRHKPSPS